MAATVKLSQLPTVQNLDNSDLLLITDFESSTSRKVTVGDFKNNIFSGDTIDAFANVDLTSTPPTDGQFLRFDASDNKWKAGDISLSSLGELSDVNTGWRKDRPEMLVTPFIFQVTELPELTPNHEVDDVVWVPLHFLLDEANREPLEWEWKGQKMETDSYLYASYRIWGLSLMMIDEMMGLLRP